MSKKKKQKEKKKNKIEPVNFMLRQFKPINPSKGDWDAVLEWIKSGRVFSSYKRFMYDDCNRFYI